MSNQQYGNYGRAPPPRSNGYGNFGASPASQQSSLANSPMAVPPPRGRPTPDRPPLRSNGSGMSGTGMPGPGMSPSPIDMRNGGGYRSASGASGPPSGAMSLRAGRGAPGGYDGTSGGPGGAMSNGRSRSPQPARGDPYGQASPMRSMPSRPRMGDRMTGSRDDLTQQSMSPGRGYSRQEPQEDTFAEQRSVAPQSNAEQQINNVLDYIRKEWPALCTNDCVPVQLALQLLDNSSVGRAHEYRNFQQTHDMLQNSLKAIVHEHHQGFNSSIGTFHQIQNSIAASQMRVAGLKETLVAAKSGLCNPDPELKKLSVTSQMYDGLIQVLDELEELRLVPDQLEARISEKRFLTAVDVLQTALRKLRKPELDDIAALGDLRSYLANQETALMDILVEELHEHLYLKSPYCQERWQSIAKSQKSDAFTTNPETPPFEQVLDMLDFERPAYEDLAKNPEADTFEYICLLVEALNRLGRLQNAVENLKNRLPVELFQIANETINEVDQRHPSSLRGTSGNNNGLGIYGSRETQMRADVIYDLLWTLYGKFEAIAEGHRVFHETIKALIRREGAGDNSALLGSFKELWNLYQNEIRTLLNFYVTSDADVYQFSTSPNPGAGSGKVDGSRDHLFRLAETDAKSIELTTEMEALDAIIQAAVPGLTDREKADPKKSGNARNVAKNTGPGFGAERGTVGTYKSLVDPSVFNMSILLPPTLVFLQRLKSIVPPGSDLATSTLTSFLDNFLVNVFQPQLDETLAKLTDTIFNEPDSFQRDQNWSVSAKKPIFKGTTSFFTIVTAFCRMLGTIPHDQALSSLLVSQMMRYYDRVFTWFKSLVAKTSEQQRDTDDEKDLKTCVRFALLPSEIRDIISERWAGDLADVGLLSKETELLVQYASKNKMEPNDVIQDRDTISSLCLIYTSMKWLAIKSQGLRHITRQDTDTSRSSVPRATSQRWSLMHDRTPDENGAVYLPLTHETVQTFDRIVTSYEELAGTALRTLHMEIRCQIMHSLGAVLSPKTAPYILDQEVSEPDPQILKLNGELIIYDESIAEYLHAREIQYIRTGLGRLVTGILVASAPVASPMNARGCGRMLLNIRVLQQNLKNVEDGVDLARAAGYYGMFTRGAEKILAAAKTMKELPEDDPRRFSYDELKNLVELCFSEQLTDPERGVATAAKRQMADKMLTLSESMWQQ